MLFRRGFFTGIKGYDPLAKAVTEHYDSDTQNQVQARADYFKTELEGIAQQFYGFGSDLRERILKMMN